MSIARTPTARLARWGLAAALILPGLAGCSGKTADPDTAEVVRPDPAVKPAPAPPAPPAADPARAADPAKAAPGG